MPKTPGDMMEAVIRNLPKNTGKSYADWLTIAKDGPKEPKARYSWLRSKHGCPHVAALILSGQLAAYEDPDKLVESQYAGKNASLRSIYDAVVMAAKSLGRDVEVKPCRTYVSLSRVRTFAVLKASGGRVDLGLMLPEGESSARLKIAKRLGSDRVTHQVSLTSSADVDSELGGWLRQAYLGAG